MFAKLVSNLLLNDQTRSAASAVAFLVHDHRALLNYLIISTNHLLIDLLNSWRVFFFFSVSVFLRVLFTLFN